MQLYRYTIQSHSLIDTPTGEYEDIRDVVGDNGATLWYHTPEEALKRSGELEEEADKKGTELMYSVSVDYWVDPYTGLGY